MDNPALSEPLKRHLKKAARELVAAAGGPKLFCALAGCSEGQVSRWCGEAYDDLVPLRIVVLVEMHLGDPVHTRCIAGLTLHDVVPSARGAEDRAAAEVQAGALRLAGCAAEAVSTFVAAAADGRIDARERRDTEAVLAKLKAEVAAVERRLSGLDL